MNNFARAHDSYLNPPGEPEAVFCEECGNEMEEIDSFGGLRDMKCVYQFCPTKFEGDAKEMAYMLLGATEEVKALAQQLRRVKLMLYLLLVNSPKNLDTTGEW